MKTPPTLIYLLLYIFAILKTSLANTETFIIDRSSINLSNESFYDSIWIPEKFHLVQPPFNSSSFGTDALISFKPKILTQPRKNHEVQTIVLDESRLRTGSKYFVKVCWSAMSPIDITISDFPENGALVINVTTNYYTDVPVIAKKFLTDIPIQIRIQANNIFHGVLNREFLSLAGFVITLVVGAIPFSTWMFSRYFNPSF